MKQLLADVFSKLRQDKNLGTNAAAVAVILFGYLIGSHFLNPSAFSHFRVQLPIG